MDEIMTLFGYAVEDFNYSFDYNFSVDNFIIQGIDGGENKEKIFEEFCSKYFPFRLNDNYKSEEYYYFLASAFPGKTPKDKQGILIRTDVETDEREMYEVMLHELAHIYCVHNELDGKNFYDEYCEDYAEDKATDGQINAGYAVWREFIADMLAVECIDDMPGYYLREKKDMLKTLKSNINTQGGAKLYLSKLLLEVMTSVDISSADTWKKAKQIIIATKIFDEPMYMELFEIVFDKVKNGSIKIDLDFIMQLGFLYLEIVTFSNIVRDIQNFKQSLTD